MTHQPIETIRDLAAAATRRLRARISNIGDDYPNDEELEIFRAADRWQLRAPERPEDLADTLGILPEEQERIQREIGGVLASALARYAVRVVAEAAIERARREVD